jgi:mannose-6-phosphate isomerase-like protein (cupin superfamily)
MSDFKLVLKQWGFEAWIVTAPTHAAKLLFVEPGPRSSSLHYHVYKDETFVCLLGSCRLEVGHVTRDLRPGDVVHVPPGVVHRFGAGPGLLLEVSSPIDPRDDDTVRLTPSVGPGLTDYTVCCLHDALAYAAGRCRR